MIGANVEQWTRQEKLVAAATSLRLFRLMEEEGMSLREAIDYVKANGEATPADVRRALVVLKIAMSKLIVAIHDAEQEEAQTQER